MPKNKPIGSVIAFAGPQGGKAAKPFGSSGAEHAKAAENLRSAAVRNYATAMVEARDGNCDNALRSLLYGARSHGSYVAHASSGAGPVDSLSWEQDKARVAVLRCFMETK